MTRSRFVLSLLVVLVASCSGATPVTTLAPVTTGSQAPTTSTASITTTTAIAGDGVDEQEPLAPADLALATVRIVLLDHNRQPFGLGSGTIVSPDGLILTNAHVAAPNAPGSGESGHSDPEFLVVEIVEQADRPPVPSYLAEVVTAEGYLDLAVLQITSTLAGDPIGALNLPFIELGDSDLVGLGDSMTVLGFPGIGENTVTFTSGRVSGFLGDDRVGDRAWIKTDTAIAPGNSGGLAADEQGRIVGIPTQVFVDVVGELGRVRPINLAKRLIDDAVAGQNYVQDSTATEGGGAEEFRFVTWTTELDDRGCPIDQVTNYPSGSASLVAVFDAFGMSPGQDIYFQWLLLGEGLLYSDNFIWDFGPQETCVWLSLDSGGSPFAEGQYDLGIYAGAEGPLIGSASTTVGEEVIPPGTGVAVFGRIVDLDTGQGIPGATMSILQPGVSAEDWFDDRRFENVLTSTQTDADGNFTLPALLEREVSYQAVIDAEGYLSMLGELRFPADMADLVELEDISLVRR